MLAHATLRLILQDAQQEAAALQQDLVYNNAAYEEVALWSVEDQQAREDAEKVCMDLQQQLSVVYAAQEAEKREAERELASLKQQLEQANVAQEAAVAAQQYGNRPSLPK